MLKLILRLIVAIIAGGAAMFFTDFSAPVANGIIFVSVAVGAFIAWGMFGKEEGNKKE